MGGNPVTEAARDHPTTAVLEPVQIVNARRLLPWRAASIYFASGATHPAVACSAASIVCCTRAPSSKVGSVPG